jgi:glycosyltransferase involved in cell wall biosynthesis
MLNPRISIVTVTFNAGAVVEKTIRSVATQTYDNLEYLIIDGASKDNTLEVVGRWRDHIDQLVSEPDGGLFDAMNKGARLAKGAWILFMNADDVFVDTDVVKDVADFIGRHPEAEVVYGDSEQILEYGIFPVKPQVEDLKRKMAICHQATFVRADVFHSHPFDLRYRYAADYEQLSHFYLEGRVFAHFDRTIARMEMRSGTTYDNTVASAHELYDIIASRGVDIEAEKRKMIRHKKMVRRFKSLIPAPLSKPILRLIAKYYKPL